MLDTPVAPAVPSAPAAAHPTLRVYSSLSRTKEPFVTVRPGQVGIYLCGPTVYKPSHVGHMVGPVIFDCIKRYLSYLGYQVTLVINITDVDDKLIAEANRRGVSMAAVAEEMTADYLRNLRAMGIDQVDHFPKATDHIDEILRLTETLIAKGYAYAAGGDVYFDVAKDREYGKLSGRTIEQLQGEGGDAADRKRSAFDFALWKGAKPGEPSWPSPWGPGRPGWHIECSAMSRKLLGETFDIHGGGLDLIFPHHENEVAQSECCHGKPQARYWLHNGLMQASSEVGKLGGRNTREAPADAAAAQAATKISKSTGARPFRELLAEFAPETIRFFLLSTHYRRPIDFSAERIEEVDRGLEKFYRFFTRYERVTGESFYALPRVTRRAAGQFDPGASPLLAEVHALREKFLASMDDDFNTGGAMGDLFELVQALNRFVQQEQLESGAKDPARLAELRQGATVLREVAGTLGLFLEPVARPGSDAGGDELLGQVMQVLIELRAGLRTEAKATKNKQLFALSDQLRDRLAALGITLEDRADGTTWTRKG